jgi:hypothetical protein
LIIPGLAEEKDASYRDGHDIKSVQLITAGRQHETRLISLRVSSQSDKWLTRRNYSGISMSSVGNTYSYIAERNLLTNFHCGVSAALYRDVSATKPFFRIFSVSSLYSIPSISLGQFHSLSLCLSPLMIHRHFFYGLSEFYTR